MGDRDTAAPNPVCLTGLAADLWPHTARLEADGDISVGGLRLSALAGRYGTPAYILDEADVRARCRAYAAAFRGAEIAYAGKAFLCRAMAGWIAQEGLSLDVCSAADGAVRTVLAHPELELVGLHCHLGSQLTRPQAYEVAAQAGPAHGRGATRTGNGCSPWMAPSRPTPCTTTSSPVYATWRTSLRGPGQASRASSRRSPGQGPQMACLRLWQHQDPQSIL